MHLNEARPECGKTLVKYVVFSEIFILKKINFEIKKTQQIKDSVVGPLRRCNGPHCNNSPMHPGPPPRAANAAGNAGTGPSGEFAVQRAAAAAAVWALRCGHDATATGQTTRPARAAAVSSAAASEQNFHHKARADIGQQQQAGADVEHAHRPFAAPTQTRATDQEHGKSQPGHE